MKKILQLGVLLVIAWLGSAHAQQGISLALHRTSPSASPTDNPISAVLLDSRASVKINAVVTAVTLTQTFENTSNDWVSATYNFPLPDNAAVDRMTMTLNDQRIVGKIRQKQVAKQLYQTAVDNGQQAALVESSRANLFTARAGNIAPHSRIHIELHYVQPTAYAAGEFSLVLPTTYKPASATEHAGTALPPAVFQQAFNGLSLNIDLDAGAMLTALESPSHEVITRIHADGQTADITTVDTQIAMDRDFRLNWRLLETGQPKTLAFTEQTDSGYYTSLMFVPSLQTEPSPLSREIILIIDTSGSMEGAAMREAKAGALAALDYLNTGDYFNLIEFNNAYSTLFSTAQPVGAETLAQARTFINSLVAGGGTEMVAPLQAALSEPDTLAQLRQVVFLTDGAVGNERQLFGLIQRELGQSRLFTVGIGAAPNHFFMRQAARAGRGSFTTIANNEDVAPAIQQLFAQLQRPSLTDIAIDLPDAGVAERYPNPIGDVYWGQPIVAHVKSALPPLRVDISAQLGGLPWQANLPPLALPGALIPTSQSALAKLWAQEKIHALTEESRYWDSETLNEAAITQLGLDYQLVTPHTAFVAIAEPIRRDPLTTPLLPQHLANQPPAGSVGFPMTATNSTVSALLAALLVLLAAALHYVNRRSA